jgi:hypothetical protein
MLVTRRNTNPSNFCQVLLQTLRNLGGSLGVNYCCRESHGRGIQEVQAVFVSCPRRAWIKAFGRPRHVRRHFDAAQEKWLWTWQQQIGEGVLRCVGHIFERSPGRPWMVVKQVRITRSGEETVESHLTSPVVPALPIAAGAVPYSQPAA